MINFVPLWKSLHLGPLDRDEPRAQHLVFKYCRRYGVLPGREFHPTYYGVYDDEDTLKVFVGELRDPTDPKYAIVTDLYAVPDRMGVAALYYVLYFYRQMASDGTIKAIRGLVLPQNKNTQRRIRDVFGLRSPSSFFYEWGSNELTAEVLNMVKEQYA